MLLLPHRYNVQQYACRSVGAICRDCLVHGLRVMHGVLGIFSNKDPVAKGDPFRIIHQIFSQVSGSRKNFFLRACSREPHSSSGPPYSAIIQQIKWNFRCYKSKGRRRELQRLEIVSPWMAWKTLTNPFSPKPIISFIASMLISYFAYICYGQWWEFVSMTGQMC